MGKDQDPKKELPGEGTPPGEAGEESGEGKEDKLIFGKYKTMEEAKKAWEERDKKFTEAHQELSKTKQELEAERQRIKDYEEKIRKIEEAETEEQKKIAEKELEEEGIRFAEAAKKGPAHMMKALYGLIAAHPSVQGIVKKTDLSKQKAADEAIAKEVDALHDANPEEFNKVYPRVVEAWRRLPPNMRQPSMVKVLYKANAGLDKEALRKQIIEEIKAGKGQGGGEEPPEKDKKKTEDEKMMEKILSQRKKDRVLKKFE